MSTVKLIHAVTEVLRNHLGILHVEEYWRDVAPRQLTVAVSPLEDTPGEEREVGVRCEVLWDDTVDAAETLVGVVECVKELFHKSQHRCDAETGLCCRLGRTTWSYTHRYDLRGREKPVFGAIVHVHCEFERTNG